MTEPSNPELFSVGPDEALVTCTTPSDETVVTRVGAQEISTNGPWHVARFTGLESDTEYSLEIEGTEGGERGPSDRKSVV